MEEKVWIYKWDKFVPGKCYGLTNKGNNIQIQVNLNYETNACNWLLLFTDTIDTQLQFLKFLKVTNIEIETKKDWWCANTNVGPREFINNKHCHYAIFLYFQSFNLHKYAYFFYNNKHLFKIQDVASLNPDKNKLLNSQYFIQYLRRNLKFSPIGLFNIQFTLEKDNAFYVKDPFNHLQYISSDFISRPIFKILSYDLEIAITDGRNGFPNGMSLDEKIVGISTVFSEIDGKTGQEIQEKRQTKLWMLVPLGVVYHPITNCETLVFYSEKEMILNYLDFSSKFHIIIGYNSNTFDNNILIARCIFLNISLHEYKDKRNIDVIKWFSKSEFEETTFVLSYQDNIDLLPYFKRYYQGKSFPSYKLDDVAEIILGKKKSNFEIYKIHEFYYELYKGLRTTDFLHDLCKYMIIDSQLPLDLFFKMNVFNMVSILCILSFCNVENIFGPISVITINCVLYKTFYPEKKPFSYERNILDEQKNLAHKYNNSLKNSNNKSKAKYQGAHMIEPITGLHKNVLVFDFASLYPSLIIKYNISPSYLYSVSKDEFLTNKLFYDKHFYNIDMKTHYNLSPKQLKTPLANIENMLINERAEFKKRKNESSYCHVMEQALKLFSNALYGLTGAETFISDIGVAASVTAYGRLHLMQCEKFFKSKNFLVLYGDTDSVFVTKSNITSVQTDCKGEDGPTLVSMFHKWTKSNFPKLEWEEEFSKLIIISKKCYLGLKKNNEYKISGFPKKIPNCVSLFFFKIIDYIFKQPNSDDCISFCKWLQLEIDAFIKLTHKNPDFFVQQKKIKTDLYLYTKKCNLPHIVFARELTHRGIDLSTLDGHIYYVPVVKDIFSNLVGTFYELPKDTSKLTINVYDFVSSYTGKINCLINIVYGLDKKYLDKQFQIAMNCLKSIRLNKIIKNNNLSVWNVNDKRVLSVIPDVRQFFEKWYNFALRFHLFRNSTIENVIIDLNWIPNVGFTYSHNNNISQWKSLIEIEHYYKKLFKIKPQFRITTQNIWGIHEFLKEILNLCEETELNNNIEKNFNHVRFFVTRFGVFDKKTMIISDCVEKLIELS